MIQLQFGQVQPCYFTLTERISIADPVFVFEFVARTPNRVNRFVLEPEYLSIRYDRFRFDVETLFEGYDAGQYLYRVLEAPRPAQGEEVELIISSLAVLEKGLMQLKTGTAQDVIAFSADTRIYQPNSTTFRLLTTEEGQTIIAEEGQKIIAND